jgi:hypothetical protein
MTNPVILIATPCYGGVVYQGYMESIIQLITYASANNFSVTLAMNGHDSLITRSRNKLVSVFLDMPQATHLMFIDADISFQPEYVHRMLQFDQDLVAGMYPVKNLDWHKLRKNTDGDSSEDKMREAGLNYVGQPLAKAEREERDGFVTAAYAGTGFKLMKRNVFERMIAAYPETKYSVAHTFPRPATHSDNQYALFECLIDPMTGTYLSEDFAFCQRWRKQGGKIWLDTQSRLTHIGVYRYEGTPAGV